MTYFFIFVSALAASFLCTHAVKKIAERFDIVDMPGAARKIHMQPIPLLGGIGIFFALLIVGGLYYFLAPSQWPSLTDAHVSAKYLAGLIVASFVLCIAGARDDAHALKPAQLVIAPAIAVVIVIAFGMGVDSVASPLSGRQIFLDQWNILLFWWNGLPRYFTLPADMLTFLWLFGTMYTTKLLDGLDGLVSGITVIGAAVIGIVSLFFFVNEPTAVLSFLTAGAFAGFLLLNGHPAKIFLGEAGSTLAGFLLGVLAIISGAKFAIAMLVLGIPILDTAWVIFRRSVIERRSPFVGDRKHLHFRLLDVGFTQWQTVGILWTVSALFGVAALFMQTQQKVTALILLMGVMVSLVFILHWKRGRNKNFSELLPRTSSLHRKP
ncbi:undecaprenyl/decaprenyl-phosphate alpha-N-acetylglucosaminyl 1-phosphate transferase [Candidatus Uhrbacteria bacterium]|nr:undecaprenyl/decaprenyl-phosphate alpha-N-acetylglucosaminyl 1-phosphate transferase [Candidatus Uhrbacteria bacterium]